MLDWASGPQAGFYLVNVAAAHGDQVPVSSSRSTCASPEPVPCQDRPGPGSVLADIDGQPREAIWAGVGKKHHAVFAGVTSQGEIPRALQAAVS